MRHGHGYRKLGRKSSHRKAMLRNLVTSLVIHNRITTTLPKAKELRRIADKIVTIAKNSKDNHDIYRAHKILFKHELTIPKLFNEMKQRYSQRPGGYTRIWKAGHRKGDNASMAIIEYVDAPGDLKLAQAKLMNKITLEQKSLAVGGIHPKKSIAADGWIPFGNPSRKGKELKAKLDAALEAFKARQLQSPST